MTWGEGGQGERVIRQARPEDLARVLKAVHECADAPSWPSAAWEAYVQSPGGGLADRLLLIAERNGLVHGVLAARHLQGESELEALFVLPALRRQGLAKTFLGEWLARAGRAGTTRAMLEVRAANRGAIRLYEASGFEVQGRRRAYYQHPADDALLMGRQLHPASSTASL